MAHVGVHNPGSITCVDYCSYIEESLLPSRYSARVLMPAYVSHCCGPQSSHKRLRALARKIVAEDSGWRSAGSSRPWRFRVLCSRAAALAFLTRNGRTRRRSVGGIGLRLLRLGAISASLESLICPFGSVFFAFFLKGTLPRFQKDWNKIRNRSASRRIGD
jgi:hypothetical protein